MSFGAGDLGVLGNLGQALGILKAGGAPNENWFADPQASLKNILANADQRHALEAFIDEVMGGEQRHEDAHGVTWLPIVQLPSPAIGLWLTVDEKKSDGLHIGVALSVATGSPHSVTSLAVPLFRARKQGGGAPGPLLLLGSVGGRLRISTEITVDTTPAVPGQARLGAIGLEVDAPTIGADAPPAFGLSLLQFQLPGSQSPRDIRVAATGADELDDALLELVLALVKAQADTAAPGSVMAAVGGLLGLKSGDSIPDFPITALPAQGVHAIAAWLHGLFTVPASRSEWLGYLATLVGGTQLGDAVQFSLGGSTTLSLGLKVDSGPTGHARLTPSLSVLRGDDAKRLEARAELFRIDLVTGAAMALPAFGAWAASGRAAAGKAVLDLSAPTVAHADVLRVGFEINAERKLNFVLAADGVVLGTHSYPTLDLTSPDALKDAATNAVGDLANQLLDSLGPVGTVVRKLLGLDPPAGVAPTSLPGLMSDPLGELARYWRDLTAAAPGAATSVLGALRDVLADAAKDIDFIHGTGTATDPWRVRLVGPLALEVFVQANVLHLGLAAASSIDTLGQRCTVVDTRLVAQLAQVHLVTRQGKLMPGVQAQITARERGVNPPRVLLPLGGGMALKAAGVGLRLGWSGAAGLSADVDAPGLALQLGAQTVPLALPQIGADGNVSLPAAAWDGVEALVGALGQMLGGFFGDAVAALGWAPSVAAAGGDAPNPERLPLSALVADPKAAFATWVGPLLLSDMGPRVLALLSDLFNGSGNRPPQLPGTGHPDDPFRLELGAALPSIGVWFPPAGLEPRLLAAPELLQRWRPGDGALALGALAFALAEEATVDAGVRALVAGRDVLGGLAALATRWAGGDGLILPPASAPAGISLSITGFAAGQLRAQLDFQTLIGRVPTTTVYVALGAGAWPAAPAGRRVDLSTAQLDATMFAMPAAATGDWFVALGTRAASRLTGSSTDGTPEQAARLGRLLAVLGAVSNNIALVAEGGAGHAARLAAQDQPKVADLLLLGTALGPVSLSAVDTQPTADALRLLQALLPPADGQPDDADLARGRALVGAMMAVADLPDPAADLRLASVPPPVPRAGLKLTALFGTVSAERVGSAITAIVAAGLAARARQRAVTPLAKPTAVHAGLVWRLPDDASGSLAVQASARVRLFGWDIGSAPGPGMLQRELQIQLRVGDRQGWLVATPELALRAFSASLSLPLDGSGAGTVRIALHEARLAGQHWEQLVVGQGGAPLLPEARILLASAAQRLVADAAGTASKALVQLLKAVGVVSATGALLGDALDQLVHDAGGLLRQRLATAAADVQAAVSALLGPLGAGIDLAQRTLKLQGGSAGSGSFGWQADVLASATGLGGVLSFGPQSPSTPAGGLRARLQLQPLDLRLEWQQPGGAVNLIPLWPQPDGMALARAAAQAAPSLGAHVALELMRRADEEARELIDALLDGLGLLAGAAGDAQRALRPLPGLLANPAGWLRAAGVGSPAKVQAIFDALRPLLGLAGAAGSPIALANGVALSVTGAGGGAQLALTVDSSGWDALDGVAGRLVAGVAAQLNIPSSGAPTVGLEMHTGVAGAAAGRRALHVRLNGGAIQLFLRPASGADISLLPFAGLGSLAAGAGAAVEAALPFVLDKLAALAAPVGPLVGAVGDALALRSGATPKFNAEALRAWALNPVAALSAVAASFGSRLPALATALQPMLPLGLTAGQAAGKLTLAAGKFSLSYAPAGSQLLISATGVSVPVLQSLSVSLGLSPAGLDQIGLTVGPASIDAGGTVLRPFITVAAGAGPAGGRRVLVGLAADDSRRFAARWLLDTNQFALVAGNGALPGTDSTVAAAVALRAVEVMLDLVAAVAMGRPAVNTLLNHPVGTAGSLNVRNLLRGVVLKDVANPSQLIAGLFDPASLLGRLQRLFTNLAGANIGFGVGPLELGFAKQSNIIGLRAGITDRFELLSDSVKLWLENDASWIDGLSAGSKGIFVGFLSVAGTPSFKPSLAINGVGLRIGKASGPLLSAGITLDSIALHGYGEVTASGFQGAGVQLQFAGLGVPASGAGGDNGIAQGVMRDTGPTPPRPSFSPALAIQKHGNAAVQVSLRAGVGDGPWWIAIRKGFGPLYLEQVGFATAMAGGKLERISVLMDGSVAMFGLSCTVDDLQITYLVGSGAAGNIFDPKNWKIDLAGLAVSADMAGLSIAGGLLKQTTVVNNKPAIEYLGMLLGRFGVYGITLYGGYGEGEDKGQKFSAFFAVGAVNGPIGGPPAFFLTGIGGGFGINRKLRVPTDLAKFGEYPLIQALDIAAKPQEPMAQLRALGAYFPMDKGSFWFAAGLAFNSFALVDGIAVVAVQVGDGLDINLLGLARMALPRPQVALVSIEIALMVRFSTKEGVLWVQGQLTDNSWLLYPDIKLTGGFAYVIWFGGEKRGEFVLTLGGYHPDFHRDGYPVVPRLGLRWAIGSAIVIKAGSYFALTSEALMAGGDFEASAHFGPAWAEVKYGAHGIVYFDPFHYHVNAYARIAAGITIDTWIFGEVTISVSLGARIDVSGPDFHGSVTFEVGPIELTVEFGGPDRSQRTPIAAPAFIAKYLEAADSGAAQAHALMTSFGAQPSKGDKATPDGSAARPFVVVAEFGLSFTSTVPAHFVTTVQGAAGTKAYPSSESIGVAPMKVAQVKPTVVLTWKRAGAVKPFAFSVTPRAFGRFPKGVWGPPQDADNRKLPKGKMIEALNELDLSCVAAISSPGPEIPFYEVAIGKRKPLPFSRKLVDVNQLKSRAQAISALVTEPATVAAAFSEAGKFLAGTASPTALAALRGERQAPPLLGTLAEGLESPTSNIIPLVAPRPGAKVYDHFIDAPIAVGMVSLGTADLRVTSRARTTVKGSERAWRVAAPTLATVEAQRSRSVAARLVLADAPAQRFNDAGTVIASVQVPPSAMARGTPALVARAGAAAKAPLAEFSDALASAAKGAKPAKGSKALPGADLQAGQAVVLKLPNAAADVADMPEAQRPRLALTGAPARVVVLARGGSVLVDRVLVPGVQTATLAVNLPVASLPLPVGAERIVAIGHGGLDALSDVGGQAGLSGWHNGLQMPYCGYTTALGPGCVVHAVGEPLRGHRERLEAGWVSGAELARGNSSVTTTFAPGMRSVLIVLDDPAAYGDAEAERQLLLGLDGAARSRDAAGRDTPPVLLSLGQRSVLAYDVVPTPGQPVVVTIASQSGWQLVGVMASPGLDAQGGIALVSARGLDAALRHFASRIGDAPSRLSWLGPVRSLAERTLAQARSEGPAALARNRAQERAFAQLATSPTKPAAKARKAGPR